MNSLGIPSDIKVPPKGERGFDFLLRGRVSTFSALPTVRNVVGHGYFVDDENQLYVYNGRDFIGSGGLGGILDRGVFNSSSPLDYSLTNVEGHYYRCDEDGFVDSNGKVWNNGEIALVIGNSYYRLNDEWAVNALTNTLRTDRSVVINNTLSSNGINNTGNITTDSQNVNNTLTSNGINNSGNITTDSQNVNNTLTSNGINNSGNISTDTQNVNNTLTSNGITNTGDISSTSVTSNEINTTGLIVNTLNSVEEGTSNMIYDTLSNEIKYILNPASGGQDNHPAVYEIGTDKDYTTIQDAIDQWVIDATGFTQAGPPGVGNLTILSAVFKVYLGFFQENITIPLRYSFIKFIGIGGSREGAPQIGLMGNITITNDTNGWQPFGEQGPTFNGGDITFENMYLFSQGGDPTVPTVVLPNGTNPSEKVVLRFDDCKLGQHTIEMGDYTQCLLQHSETDYVNFQTNSNSVGEVDNQIKFENCKVKGLTTPSSHYITKINIYNSDLENITLKVNAVLNITGSEISSGFGNNAIEWTTNNPVGGVSSTINLERNSINTGYSNFINANFDNYTNEGGISVINNIISYTDTTSVISFTASSSTSGLRELKFFNNTCINNNGGSDIDILTLDGSNVYCRHRGNTTSIGKIDINVNNNAQVFIGSLLDNQSNAIAIGESAGSTDQGSASIAIGRFAGDYQAGVGSISIGLNAGNFLSGNYSISIGSDAGYSNMGAGAIAIGEYSGYSNQSPNSIILNATGSVLNGANSGFYVKPVRTGSATTLQYDTSTGEFVYNTSSLRYKKDLKAVEGYKDLLNIEPYCFHYKEEINPQFKGCQVGFIAEHLHEYPSLRELVVYRDYYETKKEKDKNGVEIEVNIEGTKETKPESINYEKITCFNLKLIKDLYDENTLLKERLTKIEKQLNM